MIGGFYLETQTKEGKINILGSNVVYMICIILLVTVGGWVQGLDFEFGILITEFILVVVPVVLYVLYKSDKLKHVLRLNTLKFTDAVLVIITFVSSYFVAVFISIIGNIFVSLFGQLITPPIPIPTNTNEYIILLLIIAGSAGICEEILFRGLMLRAYEGLGKWKSIVFTAVLFGIMHVNVQNTLGPIFLGVILGYVVYYTNSIFAGMLGHFVNNAMAVSLSFLIYNLPIYQNIDMETIQASNTTSALIAAAVVFGFIALITGTVMVFCLIAIKDRAKPKVEVCLDYTLRSILKNIRLSWPIYVALLVFVVMTVLQLQYISS